MARKLVTLPNKVLRRESKPVKKIDSGIKGLAREMAEFMCASATDRIIPIGLSAVQLGELVRVIAFKRNTNSIEQEDVQVLINPQIVYEKGYQIVSEGCLSIPGKIFTLRRAKLVKIRGLTLDGDLRSFRGRDLLAQVFQHEINHLDGVLIDSLCKEATRS